MLLVVLTPGMLHWPAISAVVALARRLEVKFQPIMSEAQFAFPSSPFYQEMLSRGEPLGRSVAEMEARLNNCWATRPGTEAADRSQRVTDLRSAGSALFSLRLSSPVTAVEVSEALQSLFRQYAAPFDVNYKSEVLIHAQTEEIMRRLRSLTTPASRKGAKAGANGDASNEGFSRDSRVSSLITSVFTGRRTSVGDRAPNRRTSIPSRGEQRGNKSSISLEPIPSSRGHVQLDNSGLSHGQQDRALVMTSPDSLMAAQV